MSEIENYRIHAIVVGRVQGVSFRYFVLEQAEILGIYGWVRNRWDGSVELTAEGPRQKLEALLDEIRIGPPQAMVGDVSFEWQAYQGEFTDFQLRSTA